MNSTTKLPINTESKQICQQCGKTVAHLKMHIVDGEEKAICTECAKLNRARIQAVTYNVLENQMPIRYNEAKFWNGHTVANNLVSPGFIVHGGVAWLRFLGLLNFKLTDIQTKPNDYFITVKPIKRIEMIDENIYHGKFKIYFDDGSVALLPYVITDNLKKLQGYAAEPNEDMPYAEPLAFSNVQSSTTTGTSMNFSSESALTAAMTTGIDLYGLYSNKKNLVRKGIVALQDGMKGTCYFIKVTTKASKYTVPIRISVNNVFKDSLLISSLDSIAVIDGGTQLAPTYADAAAVIAALPNKVTALTGAVNIPASDWQDTDTYNAGVPNTYRFVGTITPHARLKLAPTAATISVVIKKDIIAFDAIEAVAAGTVAAPTYADAAAVIAALPVAVSADGDTISVPVATWVDTDSYNPAVAGSYTFTATLGALPANTVNTTGATVTVEVVVAEA